MACLTKFQCIYRRLSVFSSSLHFIVRVDLELKLQELLSRFSQVLRVILTESKVTLQTPDISSNSGSEVSQDRPVKRLGI